MMEMDENEACQQANLFTIQHDIWLQMSSKKYDIHGLHGILLQMEMEHNMDLEQQYGIGLL